jgi:benzoate 4-monooxygenase
MMMSSVLEVVDLKVVVAVLLVVVVLTHLVSFLWDPHGLAIYPGPFFAKFSDGWLAYVAAHGHRSEVVHALHKKHGLSFVAFTPDDWH